MSYKNLAWFTIGNTPSTSGDFTVSTAVDSLHVTLGAGDDGLSFSARIFESGVGSEVRTGCTYTHSGTTLSRGTLESSTSGSALDFTSAAQVQIIGETAASALISSRIAIGGFSAYGDGSTTVSITAGGTTLVSTAAKTEAYDTDGAFNPSTGIWQPTIAGLYLLGGTVIIGTTTSDGSTTAIYIEHSTDGSTWSGTEKRALLWRGVQGAPNASVGGSGAYLVEVNGTTDRFRLTVYYSGTGSNTCPASASNRDWIRFWAKYVGATA